MGRKPSVARRGLTDRDVALEKLAASGTEPLDVLVVGGGITGAGIALDAAARGMRTGLVERFDFASGTSSRSSKLVHGGLRYLEQREFSLVREASMERDLLGRLAPHLVEPIPFVIPVSNRWSRAMFGVGLWTYDALASFKNIKVHRYLDTEETEQLVPALPTGKMQGGFLFYDSRTNDVRLVMEVLIQARRHAADIANYARVVDISPSSEICSVTVENSLTAELFEIKARRVVVAAGVWTDRLESLTGEAEAARLRPSKGIHLVFDNRSIPLAGAAAFIPDAERRRMLFVIPWQDSVLVGTTDTIYEGDLDYPTVEESDRRYCLDAVNSAFDLTLTDDDVVGAFAGLRPLIAGKAGATADLSRRHAIYELGTGVVGITGGKLTTFRRMAVDVVDRVASDLGATKKSRTRHIKLGSSNVVALHSAVERRAERIGLSSSTVGHLIHNFGDRTLDVLDIAEQTGAVDALSPGAAPIAAEAIYCARHEMVQHLGDLLSRRTRLALTNSDAGVGPGSVAAGVLASEFRWSNRLRKGEIENYRREVETERGMGLASSRRAAAARVG
ncbi:MAG: glycerol-3-phosphate dehydrogenase/oxidase [Actinomycetota bacterium]|nr:glycerol-3-phosphate dehydrogenase/oxidase [Actinomycetota bacterium]